MRELKRALILCMCFLSLCTVTLANTENEMNMRTNANEMVENAMTSIAIVLKASDFQKETSLKEESSGSDTLQTFAIAASAASQEKPKTSATEITRQTDLIGTAEHPTIEGGLMSTPELQALSREKDFVPDERTMLILAKLNEILDRSPTYNAKALLAVGQKVSKTALKKLRMQTRFVFRFWMKKALIDANASIKPKQKSVHKARNHAHTKSLKKISHGVRKDA